jgi:hypothetical protein
LTKWLLIGLIFCGLMNEVDAQQPGAKPALPSKLSSNLRRHYVRIQNGTQKLDSLSLVPGSMIISGIPDSAYKIDYVHSTITWNRKPNLDSVLIQYRLFPYQLNGVVQRLDYAKVMDKFSIAPSTYKDPKYDQDNFFNFGNITYNGSFGRAISFGNAQDAVVTSNLNLQISGFLADSIELAAAITDNNIPIQPDGTTAELSDFDQIYIQFKKKNWALRMGDIDLRQTDNYFLSFYKRLRGGSFETATKISDQMSNHFLISGAVAKGKFNRNIIQGQEGNQGPYRLVGANNELYFIVLAGTEKVYLDGMLLQRGEDQDYTINYNTAELSFTPKRMITKDSRIQVEFEYSNQSYLNVNLYVADDLQVSKKIKLRFGVFSNSDARNSPIGQTLDDGRRKFLNELGDSINNAFYPVAPIDTGQGLAQILYRKIDTVYKASNGLYTHDSIFVVSNDREYTLYNLSFSSVGQGLGNYVLNNGGLNGNAYVWVAPANGAKQGQFEAAEFLVTPKTQQVITGGVDYNVSKETTVSADLARSRYDVNTLSTKDKGNDAGNAVKFTLKNLHFIHDKLPGWVISSYLNYEYNDIRFQPLEPIRSVEFLRDWGLPLQLPKANETFYKAAFKLTDKANNEVHYEMAGYNRNNDFSGIRNLLGHTLNTNGWHFNDQISYTIDKGSINNGYLFRPTADISRTLKKMGNYVAGINFSMEQNVQRSRQTDSVSTDSYSFSIFQAYFKSPDKAANKWGVSYFYRQDAYPYGKNLAVANRSQNVNVYTELTKNKNEQVRVNATYRSLAVVNPSVTNQLADKSLLTRVEYSMHEWKNMVAGNVLYEVGSGQEQKRNYTYVAVPAGTGQFTWIDLNGDGIQQLNEFVLAQFPDQALYIRIFTPTNDYVKANYNTFNYSFTINPRMLLGPRAIGFKKFLSNLFFQSSLQLNQKELATGFVELNPFNNPLGDTSLISRSQIFVNSFSYNKLDPHWGFDISNNRNTTKALLAFGYQTQALKEWTMRTRWNLSKTFLLNAIFKTGTNYLYSDNSAFTNSNYNINQYSIAPDISYTRRANLRISIGYNYNPQKNAQQYGGETSFSSSVIVDAKYNLVQTTSLQGKFTLNDIKYNGNTNTTVSYIMLDGLLPGKNYLWSLDLTRKLGSFLELNINYEGRKPGEGHVIHTGRASLRAIL